MPQQQVSRLPLSWGKEPFEIQHKGSEAEKKMRFQKRIKILPGISINLSKSGVSTSIGPRGAKATFGHGQQRTTIGLPGSGVSHTEIRRSNLSIVSVLVFIGLAALLILFG